MAYLHSKSPDVQKMHESLNPFEWRRSITSTEADRDTDEDETIFMINGKTSSL